MKAFASKNWALAGIALAGLMGFSHSILAYSPVGTFPAGPGIVDFPGFSPLTCNGTFTISVAPGGAATIVGASFTGGSTLCSFTTITGPWTIGPATLVSPGVYRMTISNIQFTIRQPPPNSAIVESCVGSVVATLDQNPVPHRLTFSGTLTMTMPLAGQPCPFRTGLSSYLPTPLTAP